MQKLKILWLTFSIFVAACASPSPEYKAAVSPKKITLRYAQGFDIEYFNDYKLLSVKKTTQNGQSLLKRYALISDSLQKLPAGLEVDEIIRTPVERVICLSATHAGMINHIGKLQTIQAVSGNFFYNNDIARQISTKAIETIGYDGQLNFEKIIELQPDVVFFYDVNAAGAAAAQKLKTLGISVVYNTDFMETHPLGKLEWLLYVAAFYDLEEQYLTEIEQITTNYVSISQLAGNADKPKVLINAPWQGIWYVPGGQTYMARLIADAGGDYIWKNATLDVLPLNTERVYSLAGEADIWLNTGVAKTQADLLKIDSRIIDFKAFRQQQVYNNNLRVSANGGNDYWETGVLRPDWVLKDLMHIFAGTFTADSSYFYRHLPH